MRATLQEKRAPFGARSALQLLGAMRSSSWLYSVAVVPLALASLVDDDAASAENRRRVGGVRRVDLVVVDHPVALVLVVDLDAELVLPAAAALLAVDGRQDEAVVAGSVDRAVALVLGLVPRDDQPFVRRAWKLRFPAWNWNCVSPDGTVLPFSYLELKPKLALPVAVGLPAWRPQAT